MIETISQILEMKGRDVWSTSPDDTIFDALKLMAEKRVGALVVLDSGRVVGVFSERDYATKVVLCGLSSRTAQVRQAMTDEVCFVTPETTVEEAMAICTEKRCRHLPIMEGDELLGLISSGDLTLWVSKAQSAEIQDLVRYIRGEHPA